MFCDTITLVRDVEKVLVSACLLGINCKYDGGNNKNEKVLKYLEDKEVIPICPEIMGGLPTPRTPAEQKDGKVYNKDEMDVTKEFLKGADEVIYLAKLFDVRKAILKARSPSCGVGKIYDGTFSHSLVDGNGETAKKLINIGIEVLTEEDL